MMNRIFGQNTHTYLHILGLSAIAFGLPWSKALMSVGMMFIVLNLLLEADFNSYWNNIKSNKIFWLVAGLFLLKFIGMLWTENTSDAINSIKRELPFITIPTILVARPIKKAQQIDLILLAFMVMLLVTSILNFGNYKQWFGPKEYDDIRGMSLFISHIRFGLLVSMGGAICLYAIKRYRKALLPIMLIFLWLAFYTIYSQIISGVLTFSAVIGAYLVYQLWLTRKIFAQLFIIVCIGIATAIAMWLFKPLKFDKSQYQDLPEFTAEGNEYEHNFKYLSSETEEPVLTFLCELELEREWEKRSDIGYHGTTISGNPVSHTLIRYLASKGLHRDAVGIKGLTDQDIKEIEQGCTSVNHDGIMARMHSIRFELNNADDPNGHSLLQRLEYWKAGANIAKKNWFIGVGTGDAQLAFDSYYRSTNSLLNEDHRRRAHNQFLTFLLTYGILGFLMFAILLVMFFRFNLKHEQLLGILFIIISSLSFLIEDTLETQAGVTFFALFLGIFLSDQNKSQHPEKTTD